MLKRFTAVLLAIAVCLLGAACKKSVAQNLVERKQEFQAQQRKKAIENYQQILKKYPDSEIAAKAQERLRALNAQEQPSASK
jgi:outer membrane protein assembly factor BamD (BamD/ComL family)